MRVVVSRANPPKVSSITQPRSTILDAALAILQRQGAGALTVRSVAAAAGCSTTGVYTWFGGKNGLVEAIFIDGFETFATALRDARGSAPPGQPLAALAAAYRRWAISHPTQYMVMFGRAVPDYRPSEHALAVAMATFDDLVAATATTMATVAFAGSPAEIAHHLWAGIHGYVSLELAGMDMASDEGQRTERFELGVRRLLDGCLG